MLVSYPAALAVQFGLGGGAETVIHVVTGTGFLPFATAVFDFPLPRWANVVGAAAAGAFGAILLLQGIADMTGADALRSVGYDILGRQVERLLPDAFFLWCIALLFLVSTGRSRVLGNVIMLIVVGAEVATLASLVLGFAMPNLKVAVLLPFVWLLTESIEPQRSDARARDHDRDVNDVEADRMTRRGEQGAS